ncbi:hypothetical protein M3Y96_00912300 [Aphelenchoides besseyi]|nr:hypothetical protein M3Y96_00912300 [Aphelenchoides besseyi]
MSLFNQTNQLGREVSELKKLVESMDTKVKQLQKRVQEKSAVEIEHEDVKRRVYSPHEVVVKTIFTGQFGLLGYCTDVAYYSCYS